MGQKVNPIGLRVGVNRGWESNWFAEGKQYIKWLHDDITIRDLLFKKLKNSAISKIIIERKIQEIKLIIKSARPRLILGDGAKNLPIIIKDIKKAIKDRKIKIKINVVELLNPDLSAKLIAESIAFQIKNRASFRLAQKFAIKKAKKAGAKGIKTSVSGRLNGVDMARTEGYLEGNVPLATIRSDIDYALAEALTTYGQIGVKVWIYKGELLPGLTSEINELRLQKRKKRSFNNNNNFWNKGKNSEFYQKNSIKKLENKKDSLIKKGDDQDVNAKKD